MDSFLSVPPQVRDREGFRFALSLFYLGNISFLLRSKSLQSSSRKQAILLKSLKLFFNPADKEIRASKTSPPVALNSNSDARADADIGRFLNLNNQLSIPGYWFSFLQFRRIE